MPRDKREGWCAVYRAWASLPIKNKLHYVLVESLMACAPGLASKTWESTLFNWGGKPVNYPELASSNETKVSFP
jgi:hypothetical protein